MNYELFRTFAGDMKQSYHITNVILAVVAGILAVLCVLSIMQH